MINTSLVPAPKFTRLLLFELAITDRDSVVPEAVTGTKDATETKQKVILDKDGNYLADEKEEADWIKGKEEGTYPSDSTWHATKVYPLHQGIDQAKLVPLLVKTVQELEARIKALEEG